MEPQTQGKESKITSTLNDVLVSIGKDVIKAQKFTNLDPLIGDHCCQLRAIVTIILVKILQSSSMEGVPLELAKFLGASSLMTLSTTTEFDVLGLISKQFPDPVKLGKILQDIDPKVSGWGKTKLAALGAELRGLVADFTLSSMLEWFKKDFDRNSEIIYCLENPRELKTTQRTVKYIPFFASVVATLRLASSYKIPILVRIKRYVVDPNTKGGEFTLQASELLLYTLDENSAYTCQSDFNSDITQNLCLYFEMISSFLQDTDPYPESSNKFYLREHFADFIQEFRILKLEDIILCAAARHRQVIDPQNQKEKEGDATDKIVKSALYDQTPMLKELYLQKLALSEKEGFGIEKFTNDTRKMIPANIFHVYISQISS